MLKFKWNKVGKNVPKIHFWYEVPDILVLEPKIQNSSQIKVIPTIKYKYFQNTLKFIKQKFVYKLRGLHKSDWKLSQPMGCVWANFHLLHLGQAELYLHSFWTGTCFFSILFVSQNPCSLASLVIHCSAHGTT